MSRIKEVTLKELRLDLTKLTQNLDDRTTLVVTRNKTPIAVIQYVAPERRGLYSCDSVLWNERNVAEGHGQFKPRIEVSCAAENIDVRLIGRGHEATYIQAMAKALVQGERAADVFVQIAAKAGFGSHVGFRKFVIGF